MRPVYMIDLCQAQIIRNEQLAQLVRRGVTPEQETARELLVGVIALAVIYGLLTVLVMVQL